MESMFAHKLAEAHTLAADHICIGIDPHLETITGDFFHAELNRAGKAEFVLNLGRALLNVASAHKVASVKFQSAFFEAIGPQGLEALRRLIADANSRRLISILDVKRGDISSTMRAYGRACFDEFQADAITVLPYMGLDTIAALKPWLEKGKGVYLVWISSNPESRWLQSLIAEPLLRNLQHWLEMSNLAGSCGLVLGATKVEELSQGLFERASDLPLLMPGLGAQGAEIGVRLQALQNHNRTFILPVSRGVSIFGMPGAEAELDACGSWSDYEQACANRLKALRANLSISKNS